MTPEERAAKKERKARAVAKKDEGNQFYRAHQFDEALAAYKEAAEIDPDDITYTLNQSAVHFEREDWAACVKSCQEAVARGRDVRAPWVTMAKAFARMGNAYVEMGDLPAAIDAYDRSLIEHRSEDVSKRLKETKAAWTKKKDEEYKDPQKAEEANVRANAAFHSSDFPKAIAEYSEAIKRDPLNAKYWTNRATARAKLMDWSGSYSDAQEAVKLDPSNIKGYIRVGNAQYSCKELHKAFDTFKKAMSMDPNNAEAKAGLEKTVNAIRDQADKDDPERQARALADPEIQRILKDPAVTQAVEDIRRDFSAYEHIRRTDSVMYGKLEKLIAAGIMKVGRG